MLNIKVLGLLLLIPKLFFCQVITSPLACTAPFYHGVASGDPLSDKVIIWTRVTPIDFSQSISGTYKVAVDSLFNNVISSGVFNTDFTSDFTVKIDVSGLNPNTFYFYRFETNGKKSPIGRTKTVPVGTIDNMRFAVVSCANLESGYFNAYKAINERNDADAIIMLGDYIYEYEEGYYDPNSNVPRDLEPSNEVVSLADYRMRYSSYRLDRSLQRLHQNYPWICVWDDHEFANNAYKDGAQNHDSNEGNWYDRKEYAKKAYFEWLPIRPSDSKLMHIYRKFEFGDLFSLLMVDTRIHGREEQLGVSNAQTNDTNRTLLGDDQFEWLKAELTNSNCTWNTLGNQVVMAEVTILGIPFNSDAWDGYPAQRNKLFDFIIDNDLDNFCVLTGDIHTSWAIDLKKGNDKVGVEFVTTSVTSPGVPINASFLITIENPHVKYVELTKKGFILLDVTPQKIQSDWYYVNTINQDDASNYWAKGYYSNNGDNNLIEATSASTGHGEFNIPLMSECPSTSEIENEHNLVVLGIYPNPVSGELSIQFNDGLSSAYTLEIYSIGGEKILDQPIYAKNISGILHTRIRLNNLRSGSYILKITNVKSGKITSKKFIKK